ncbi:hypothetical protein [Burkholderia latens]|uniref:hypothetical protein n=1 Tax=Burkholderia latens TaxID=488446 RepID=UPI001588D50A|nr:hypothetical protein [Burkholderia latens]
MISELAETVHTGGDAAGDALDVLIDIAAFRASPGAAADAENCLLALYESAELPAQVRNEFNRKLIAQCKVLIEPSDDVVKRGFGLPAALGYLAASAGVDSVGPSDDSLCRVERERLDSMLRDAADLQTEVLAQPTRMVTNDEVADSVCCYPLAFDRELEVHREIAANDGGYISDTIRECGARLDEQPALYVPLLLAEAKHFVLLVLERDPTTGQTVATIMDTLGMLAYDETQRPVLTSVEHQWRNTLNEIIRRAKIDDIAIYSMNVQEHIPNSCGPLVCRMVEALQSRADAAEQDIRYASDARETIYSYLRDLEQRAPEQRGWVVSASRARMIADRIEVRRHTRFVGHSALCV